MKKLILAIIITLLFSLLPKTKVYAGMQPLTPDNVKKVLTTSATASEFCKLKIGDTSIKDFSVALLRGYGQEGQDPYITTLDQMSCTDEKKGVIYGTLKITRNIPGDEEIYEQVFVIDDHYLRPTNMYTEAYTLTPTIPDQLDTDNSIRGIFKGISVKKGSLKNISDVETNNYADSNYYDGEREFGYIVHVDPNGTIDNIYVLYKGSIYKYTKTIKEIKNVLLVDYTNSDAVLTPKPDPTANWETYQGQGFSFKYPPEWNYRNENGNLVFTKKIPQPRATESAEQATTDKFVEASINIAVIKNTQNMTLDAWTRNEVVRRGLDKYNPVFTTTTVAGQDAIQTVFPTGFAERLFVFMKDENIFVISYKATNDEEEIAKGEMKMKILSTFKFTN